MHITEFHFQELRRFAELGRLSASMIHEISNPLTAALLQLEISDHSSPAVRNAKRNMHMLRRYVEAARQQIHSASRPKSFSVQPQVQQLKRVLLPAARQANVKLEFNFPPVGCKLYGDPVKFQQIVANLTMNAIQAYGGSSRPTRLQLVSVSIFSLDESVIIQVQDWGKGIAPSEMPKIFEPFYTTKTGTRNTGMGIGLSIVRQTVIDDFRGSMKVKSSPRTGTQFTVKLRQY